MDNDEIKEEKTSKSHENKAKSKAEKISKKLKEKTMKKAATKGKLVAGMGPVIFWVVIFLLVIIILIGVSMFFVSMPGMVMEKIKRIFSDLGNYVSAFFGADTTKQIKQEDIYQSLDYLEEMGYDLKGFGFITDYYKSTDSNINNVIADGLTEEDKALDENGNPNYVVDDETGVIRRASDNKILLAQSDFIFTYIASDNYIYTLKNTNLASGALDSTWRSFWDFVVGIVESMRMAEYKIKNYLMGPIYDFLGITNAVQETWGRGLINLYYEGGALGKKGDPVNTESFWNHDEVKIDTKSKMLVIGKNSLFEKNAPMKYSLDGWTGRYGMPAEFLMSVHLATMMPDLSYKMATDFNTNVNIYLRNASGIVNSYFINGKGERIEYAEIKDINQNTPEGMNRFVELGMAPASHPESCGCEKHEENGKIVVTRVCNECKEYIKKIKDAMAGVYDGNYNTYVPYIADVTDHWYRNVYFVVDTQKNNDIEFVVNDYDYEIYQRERWSLYETYSENENSEKVGEFKLYLVTPEGEYADLDALKQFYADKAFKADGSLKEKITSDSVHNQYYLYDGTQEEANKEGLVVSKKAVTLKLAENGDTVALYDLNWKFNTTKIWTAYTATDDGYVGDLEDAYPDSKDPLESSIKTQVVVSSGYVKQVGEAQRSETNPKIKEMFLSDTFFRYDGTAERAEIITALRDKIKEEKLGEKGIKYGALNALINEAGEEVDATELSYKASELGLPLKTENGNQVDEEYKVSEYSGQVSINQDSLNAFSMLENTHTLDADYIYRDFKELVVELGYFSKEELTDEVPKLLEWLVPDTPSSGYPNRAIDKNEHEYGTMIHSKGDIDVLNQYTIQGILSQMQEAGEEVNEESLSQTAQNLTVMLGTSVDDLFDTSATSEFAANITNEDVLQKAQEIFAGMINAPDGIRFEYCVGNRPEECATCSDTCKANRKHSKNYCSCTSFHCNHVSNDGRGCGYEKTFQEAIDSPKLRNVCCAVFVSWVLRDLGVDLDAIMEAMNNPNAWRGAYSVCRMCIEYLGAEVITDYDELMPGDIMGYVYNEGDSVAHVDILGEEDGESFKIYGCGVVPDIGGSNENPNLTKASFQEKALCFGMRFGGSSNKNKYVGYDGNEMVVSPVTGILLEYGTYEPDPSIPKDWDTILDVAYRLNVDLKYGPVIKEKDSSFISQNVSDKVGYAKILVLDTEHYQYLESSVSNSWNPLEDGKTSLVNPDGTFRETLIDTDGSPALDKLKPGGWSEIDKAVYAYKEFAELYEKAGIAGRIIYIDGFVCEEPDESLKNDKEVSKKIPYSVENTNNENANSGEATKYTAAKDEAKITIDTYKTVTPDNFTDDKVQLKTEYREDEVYVTASTAMNHKNQAEIQVKAKATNSLYIDESHSQKTNNNSEKEPIIFIKEGTILGRTMTDKELLDAEYLRNGEGTDNSYESIREGEDKNSNKIIGNYLRIIMRDTDGVVVEDVEDYMKLDYVDELDWFELFFWTPFESGGADLDYEGPECVSSCTPGEVGVGLVQETDTVEPYHDGGHGGAIAKFFKKCIEEDPVLCAPLRPFTSWDGHAVWKDISGDSGLDWEDCIRIEDGKKKSRYEYGVGGAEARQRPVRDHIRQSSEIQKALRKVDSMDRERFIKIQMKIAKEQYLDPILERAPWLAERPECVQGAVMHLHVWGAAWSWIVDYEEKSDEEILKQVRYTIANTNSTSTDATGDEESGRAWNEPEIAFGILDGRLSRYDVEEWVRTADTSILTSNGIDYRK